MRIRMKDLHLNGCRIWEWELEAQHLYRRDDAEADNRFISSSHYSTPESIHLFLMNAIQEHNYHH